MKMTKNSDFLRAFPASQFAYLHENKVQLRFAWVKNAPTPTPLNMKL
jgi:hypothetical protein